MPGRSGNRHCARPILESSDRPSAARPRVPVATRLLFGADLRASSRFAIMPGVEGQAMPLHDWKDERGWDGVHLLWLAQLLDWIQPRLPPGFRAYVGSVPALTLEAGNG